MIASEAESGNPEQLPPAARAVDEQLLTWAFARLRPIPLGLSVGLVAGLVVLVATAALLLREDARAQNPVGPHLGLLRHFFPGYSVTWPGAWVGLGYGFVAGFGLGLTAAALVNLNHLVYVRILARRLRRGAMQDGL